MKNTRPWWLWITASFFAIFAVMEYVVNSGDAPAFMEYAMARYFMLFILLLLIAIALIVQAIENVMFQTLSEEAKVRYLESSSKKWEWKWGKATYKRLMGAKPIEEEGEIVLDHNYDGIRELDNKLPPWWVYMFYASIVFGFVYMLRFHVFGGYDQDLEYEQNVAAAQVEIEAYKKNAKGLVDANTVELLTDASDINAGEAIFTANCVACHMADGGGGIGPNLTDDHWILGGGIKNVFHTISEGGRDGKGMIAWKQNLKPLEMAQVASYVLTEIYGKAPASPKAPEGDIWRDPDAPEKSAPADELPEQKTDSATVAMNR